MELYRIENLTFTYLGAPSPALRGVSTALHAGEFVTLCGASGSGKSTLLRQMKTSLAPNGMRTGEVFFDGRALSDCPLREQAARIGFVGQHAENQIVTDKVWHELAFGLENLGCPTQTIRLRVAEMAAFFGLEELFHRDTASLSGGQKQLLNLAAVLTMQPDVLVLDEPTAQLDPIAAEDFLSALARVNRELGTTILLSEQRLEEALPLSDRALVLAHGQLIADGSPREIVGQLRAQGGDMLCAMPAAMRVWAAVGGGETCPVSVREGRAWLAEFARTHDVAAVPTAEFPPCTGEIVAEMREVWFRYAPDAPDVLRGLSLHVRRGELTALLGGNGAGKSTALKLLAMLQKPYRGTVRACGKVALLPQDVQMLFAHKTVREELLESGAGAEETAKTAALCRLEGLLDRHPYDLSGGEQQRVALAKLLLTRPEILLLDEPTRGLDAAFKQTLARILKQLCARGMTVILVSHDVEFCAMHAARCALFFDGGILAAGAPREFFSRNRFYTTAANRIAREVLPDALTADDLIAACGGSQTQMQAEREEADVPPPRAAAQKADAQPARQKKDTAKQKALARAPLCRAAAVIAGMLLTLLLGLRILGNRGYYALSLALLAEGMLPFFFSYERRRPGAREIVVIAVLCALGVALRAAFFMLPQCKPVLALTIVSGAALGGEAGFLVGAVTMLVSNMLFSQGPWTPWQMFGMGLCGFLAGILFRRGGLAREKWTLSLFGGVSALALYGPLLNASSALLATGTLRLSTFLAYCVSGFPMDCVHAAATVAFLWFLSEPMLEKLARVRKKYGIGGETAE